MVNHRRSKSSLVEQQHSPRRSIKETGNKAYTSLINLPTMNGVKEKLKRSRYSTRNNGNGGLLDMYKTPHYDNPNQSDSMKNLHLNQRANNMTPTPDDYLRESIR